MGNVNEGRNESCVTGNEAQCQSSLVSRNVTILGRRTSIRLEPEMWKALRDIAEREVCSIHDVCTLVFVRKKDETSFTAAIRVFLMLYFRAAATENGHRSAGHGDFESMMRRARVSSEYDIHFKCRKRQATALARKIDNDNVSA